MAEIPERWMQTYKSATEYYAGRSNIEKVIEELGTAEARIRELEMQLQDMRSKEVKL